MKEWVTIAEGALLIGRHVSRVYRRIDEGHLATRKNNHGVTEVLAKAVLRVEPQIK